MTTTEKAIIKLGNLPFLVEQAADGTYKLELGEVASAIGESSEKIISFLDSQRVTTVTGYIPVSAAVKFWMTEAINGNVKAQSLAFASMVECVERRADSQFLIEDQNE